MKTSLIITTYNWAGALRLCLKSVMNQSVLPNEVIIADDGSRGDTKELIDSFRDKIKVPIYHVWHEDEGFRLAEIRNKAILVSSGDYIIFVDGDVILHRKFVEDHNSFAKKGFFVKATRVSLGMNQTKKLIENGNIDVCLTENETKFKENGIRCRMLSFVIGLKNKATSDGITGSNMAFWKKDVEDVNGFNNDMQGWGAEDKEFAQRLVNLGLRRRKLKFSGIQYHLWHKESDKKNQEKHLTLIRKIEQGKEKKCVNGLHQCIKNYVVYE